MSSFGNSVFLGLWSFQERENLIPGPLTPWPQALMTKLDKIGRALGPFIFPLIGLKRILLTNGFQKL